ncbi:hypothetical protein [Frigidibacter sp. ROC022]|uniref:hypothetical protein n=1 Tax=Frigidibacter sp. ROC022 TaxID=2971796 RepID=UPI00215A9F95|nr:hypothetical protein [Frigidibacter sp. ROC022]MCR8722924.1 hypothetical protein [Frigidibacter sp. ROC022]
MKIRNLMSLVFSLALAGEALAVDYGIIAPDQIYDYDVFGQFTNPRAKVLDKRNGQVLIQILEGDRAGEVEWVSPSKLLTLDESRKQESENIGAGIGIGIAVICAITGGCKDDAAGKGDSGGGTIPKSMPDDVNRKVVISNRCSRPFDIWLAYYLDGQFRGNGDYWTIKPAIRTYLTGSSGAKVIADNDQVYYFAKSTDGQLVWNGRNKTKVRMEGKVYDMRPGKMVLKSGEYELALTCD